MFVPIILESKSNEEKIISGIRDISKEIPDLEVMLQYASPELTPKLFNKIIDEINFRTLWDDVSSVFIGGVEKSSSLIGSIKAQVDINDLVLALPLSDSTTYGLSSVLSGSERPLHSPVISVGLDNSYAALNIAHRFLQGYFNNSEIKIVKPVNNYDLHINSMKQELDKLRLRNSIVSRHDIKADDVVFSVGYEDSSIGFIDELLSKGEGVQISICYRMPDPEHLLSYVNNLEHAKATGRVGINAFENGAIIAAQLTGNKDALSLIEEAKQRKKNMLEAQKTLYIKNGRSDFK
jgi:phosphoribosylcarboxyaminoimidazole (NCAIR) mutase